MDELITVYLHLQSVRRDEGRRAAAIFTFTVDQSGDYFHDLSLMKNVDGSLTKTKMTLNVFSTFFFCAHQHFWTR